MAKVTKDQVKAALTEAGVAFPASAGLPKLQALLPDGHTLKAVAENTQAGAVADPAPQSTELKTHAEEPKSNLPYIPASKVPASAAGVVFHLNDKVTKTRAFNEEDHGKDWQDTAEEFHKTNEKKIIKREVL